MQFGAMEQGERKAALDHVLDKAMADLVTSEVDDDTAVFLAQPRLRLALFPLSRALTLWGCIIDPSRGDRQQAIAEAINEARRQLPPIVRGSAHGPTFILDIGPA